MNGRTLTAEQLRTQCAQQASVLVRASQSHAASGRVVESVAAMLAAEIASLQATLIRHLLIESKAPFFEYFELGQQLAASLSAQTQGQETSAAEQIRAGRTMCAHELTPVVLEQWSDTFADLAHLERLPAVTESMLDAFVSTRLQGRTAAQLVHERRRQAQEAFLRAQAQRMQGDAAAAIRSAYEGDSRSLEAYLVESAQAAGDVHLLTVSSRWDLASAAVAELSGLPDGFVPAVEAIRRAVVTGLGEPDGGRLADSFSAL